MNPILFSFCPRTQSVVRSVRAPIRTMAVLMAGLALAAAAQAQWKWRDADGRTQYSDRPPPFGTPDKDILSRPASPRAAAMSAPSAASRPGSASQPGTASAPTKAASTPAELAEAQRRAQEEQRRNQMRADNCRRAREHVASLEGSPRISRLNARGEREFLNDSQMQAERDHARSVMSSDCQ
jgi:hypothetical protein